jgi:hypothetical protein
VTLVPRAFFFLFPLFTSLLIWHFYTMTLWREFGLQLRRALPKATAGDMCLAQSRRYVSHSATPWRTGEVANTHRWGLGTHKGLRPSLQGWKTAQRCFSGSAQAAHGHITPPKPGEE